MDVTTDGADEPVDVSVLEALIELRRQQEIVDQLCRRAEDMKAAVAPAVYERVVADYARRREGLEHQAAPLITRALAEYRKLRALHAAVQARHDAARLDRDEIEFRHSLGEIDDPTRDERLKAPEAALSAAAGELAKLDAHDARFREALPDVDASLAAPDAAPEAGAAPEPGAAAPEPAAASQADVAETVPEPDQDGEGDGEGDGAPIFEPDPLSVAALAQEKTVWLSDPPPPIPFLPRASGEAVARAEIAAGPAVLIEAIPPIPAGDADEAAEAGGGAALISESDDGRSVNYQLTALTYIGRAEDNQIRILDPGISRRHVLITATAQGYTLRDLKSQNGTYLNGERIDETPLADGDRITLGEVTLIFRRPAAASADDEPGTSD